MLLFPHAKINLGLDIVRRRPDGYHDIVTVMVPTRWEDVLELTPSSSGRTELIVTGRAVDCPPEKNLVMKAFRAISDATGGIPPTTLRLHKIIPDGAGLGGGSADAAFTLRGLNMLYDLGLPDRELCRLAASIGADCPFFISDRPMLCTGTGTVMSPIDVPQIVGKILAIVKPPVSVNTATAYSRVTPREPAESLTQRIARPLEQWQNSVVNDFEGSVFPQFPQLAGIKEALLNEGAVYSAMSGSGSSLFGIFSCQSADKLAERLKSRFTGCDVHVAEL